MMDVVDVVVPEVVAVVVEETIVTVVVLVEGKNHTHICCTLY